MLQSGSSIVKLEDGKTVNREMMWRSVCHPVGESDGGKVRLWVRGPVSQ